MSEVPFSGLRPPRAPAELRGRVLAACAETAARGESDGFLDLLWRSRGARWAWLILVATLLSANLVALRPPAGDSAARRGRLAAGFAASLDDAMPGWWRARGLAPTWADLGPAPGPPGEARAGAAIYGDAGR